MTIAPAITTLKIGDTAALELRAIFSDRPAGTIRSELVNQTSDNPNVVTIAPSGSVTDIGAGTGAIIARITAQPDWRAELQIRVVPR